VPLQRPVAARQRVPPNLRWLTSDYHVVTPFRNPSAGTFFGDVEGISPVDPWRAGTGVIHAEANGSRSAGHAGGSDVRESQKLLDIARIQECDVQSWSFSLLVSKPERPREIRDDAEHWLARRTPLQMQSVVAV
jgi:hypothetical protein